jgi:hypothetical protein
MLICPMSAADMLARLVAGKGAGVVRMRTAGAAKNRRAWSAQFAGGRLEAQSEWSSSNLASLHDTCQRQLHVV